jgi:hypothetical protein
VISSSAIQAECFLRIRLFELRHDLRQPNVAGGIRRLWQADFGSGDLPDGAPRYCLSKSIAIRSAPPSARIADPFG